MKKKILSLLLVFFMCMSVVPATAFMADNEETTELQKEEIQTVIDEENKKSEADEVEAKSKAKENIVDEEKEDNNQTFEEKSNDKVKNSSSKSLKSSTSIYRVDVEQKKINYLDVNVTVPNADDLKDITGADSIKVTAKMYYGKAERQSVQKSAKLSELNANVMEMKFPAYGKYSVKVEILKGKDIIKTITKEDVGVVAEEYNFAPLNGTMAPLLTSLNLWKISKNEKNEPIPTFMVFDRPKAYNWDKLPENVYSVPYLTEAETTTKASIAPRTDNQTATYLKDLYELNPSSKFHIYCADNYQRVIFSLLYQNNIPDSNSTITMISDGADTYKNFQAVYQSSEDVNKQHDDMKAEYKALVQKAKDTKSIPDFSTLKYYSGKQTTGLNRYEYAVFDVEKEKDANRIQWWVINSSALCFPAEVEASNAELKAFSAATRAKVTGVNINTFLNGLSGDEQKEFKELYNIGDMNPFSEAKSKNKKVMVILGTKITTSNSPNLDDYTRFLNTYYGDDYVLYFKGHPQTPTELYPNAVERLRNLEVNDLNASIPAELFMFFYPDIYLSGYSSSTFQSLSSDEMGCTIFEKTYQAVQNDSSMTAYRNKVSSFMSKITNDAYYEDYQKYVSNGHTCYLVEFNKDKENSGYDKHPYAIWDVTAGSYKAYKDDKVVDEKNFTYQKQTVTTSASNYKKVYGDKPFLLNAKTTGKGSLSYKSSNNNVVSVDSTGKVTIKGAGSATITVTASATLRTNAATKNIKVTVSKKSQKITSKASSYKKVYGSKAFSLGAKASQGGKLTYKSSNKKLHM
ncbi:hypothetical protein [Anaerofustis stercorihominis]|uniref:BIG2 domain-containing protein n=1 Tax=Anaerofustis stercorihominis TaxID=214853 RepID=A0A3E3DZG7_9FIRM|nr:hypothetical protein [Anaerofustis stercorihominis]RGD74329.1 hypothetical protein DW687_06070 [Anaerofustis stercorihominis]